MAHDPDRLARARRLNGVQWQVLKREEAKLTDLNRRKDEADQSRQALLELFASGDHAFGPAARTFSTRIEALARDAAGLAEAVREQARRVAAEDARSRIAVRRLEALDALALDARQRLELMEILEARTGKARQRTTGDHSSEGGSTWHSISRPT